MTRYLLYFLTGFAHAFIIQLYEGLSAGPASYYPTLGLAGAVGLFAVASWLTLFNIRVGSVLALLSLLLLIPWTVTAVSQTLQQETAIDNITLIIHAVLAVLLLASLIVSVRFTFSRRLSWRKGTPKPAVFLKILLALIPVSVVVAWVVVMRWPS
ncbi:MAG: hypothetical protein LPK07_11640 [Hymenobacteraceae bacterium]|nr:hypothetical protein [Hymenobacteraceae bacterium]MDX5482323.1 hypothetical protein [Hymenobacteraceae bacterium]